MPHSNFTLTFCTIILSTRVSRDKRHSSSVLWASYMEPWSKVDCARTSYKRQYRVWCNAWSSWLIWDMTTRHVWTSYSRRKDSRPCSLRLGFTSSTSSHSWSIQSSSRQGSSRIRIRSQEDHQQEVHLPQQIKQHHLTNKKRWKLNHRTVVKKQEALETFLSVRTPPILETKEWFLLQDRQRKEICYLWKH